MAEAAYRLGLQHVVITSVSRDDLPDGGAAHFCRTVAAVRNRTSAKVEVLTPDFVGCPAALDQIIDIAPDVFNHNTETVPRLYRPVRGPKSDYRWTLELLRRVKQQNPRIRTKSGLMLGLGETWDEVLDVLADLRGVGCDFLTLGQYLQPATDRYLPVQRYWPPEEFNAMGRAARALGFLQVASGPFVRSSYHARDMAESHCQPAFLTVGRNKVAQRCRNSANAIFRGDTVCVPMAVTRRPKFRQRRRLLVPAYAMVRNVGLVTVHGQHQGHSLCKRETSLFCRLRAY